MSTFLSSIGLAELVAGVMIVALNAYVLTGGADFGGGLWDLLASGPRRDAPDNLDGFRKHGLAPLRPCPSTTCRRS